jgi:hypothetical protein
MRVQRRAHSITFGTRNRPSSTAGALRWLAALVGLGDGVVAQAQRHRLHRRQRRVQRLDAVVSTALICSTMPKKPLSWPASRRVRRATVPAAPDGDAAHVLGVRAMGIK